MDRDGKGRFIKGHQVCVGRIFSEDTKKKLSETHIGNTNCLGYKHTDDAKKKMSALRMGKYSGEDSPTWKGGSISLYGYTMLRRPTHPNCGKSGYVYEHRLVMEEVIGRYLLLEEVVHHINGVKDDNRIENLLLFNNNGEHRHCHSKTN